MSHHRDCRGICRAEPLEIWWWEGRACNSQHKDLSRPSSHLWTQVVILPWGFAHCRIKSGAHSDEGTWLGTDLPDIDPQMRSFASRRAQCPYTQARSWVTDSPQSHTMETVLRPIWPKGRLQLLETVQLSGIWVKGKRTEPIGPKAKPVPSMEHSHATHRRGINLQPRLRVAPGASQMGILCRKLRLVWNSPSPFHPGKELNHRPLTVESVFWPHLTRRAGTNS